MPLVRPVGSLDREQQLMLLDELGFAVWVYDGTDTRYVNQALSDLSGYTVEELLQPGFFESLVVPSDRELMVQRGRARIRGEDVPSDYEVTLTAKNGETRRLELKARRIELNDGPASLVSAVDVSELRAAEQALHSGAQRVRRLLDLIPAHVITTDAAGNPTLVNQHWLTYTGMTRQEAMASGTATVIHPDDVEEAAARWAEAKATAEGYDIDYRIKTPAGDYRWNSFRIRPFIDDGVLLGWVSVSVDVNESKELEEQLRRANGFKDDILGLVSHELRTPLTTLRGFATTLRKNHQSLPPETMAEALGDIEHSAERLYRIVEDMLTLARSGSNRRVETEPVLLRRILAEVAAEHERAYPGSSIRVHAPQRLLPALGDATWIRQIFTNLFSNAMKYSPGDRNIDVTLESDGSEVTVTVSDRGIGISEDLLESVFQPFFRAPNGERAAAGIGLGLPVCRALIEAQGGRIWVQRREGGGSSFAFTLPLIDEPESD